MGVANAVDDKSSVVLTKEIYNNNRIMTYMFHITRLHLHVFTLPVDCVRVVDTLIVTVEDENVDVSPVIYIKHCSFSELHILPLFSYLVCVLMT